MLAQLAPSFPAVAGPGVFLGFTVFWGLATAFWLWMLVDCLTKRRLPDNEKLVWAVAMLFTHLFGALLYLVLVRNRRRPGGA